MLSVCILTCSRNSKPRSKWTEGKRNEKSKIAKEDLGRNSIGSTNVTGGSRNKRERH